MNIVEMRQTEPIIQEQTKIPQSQRRTVPELRDGTRENRDGAHGASRERTARSA